MEWLSDLIKYGELVLEGLGNTLLIFAVTIITSIPLGCLWLWEGFPGTGGLKSF